MVKTSRPRLLVPLPKCKDGATQHVWQDRSEGRWGGPDRWCSACGIWRGDYASRDGEPEPEPAPEPTPEPAPEPEPAPVIEAQPDADEPGVIFTKP